MNYQHARRDRRRKSPILICLDSAGRKGVDGRQGGGVFAGAIERVGLSLANSGRNGFGERVGVGLVISVGDCAGVSRARVAETRATRRRQQRRS